MKLVDVHSHMLFPCYMDAMAAAGVDPAKEDGFPSPKWSAEAHLAYMDQLGLGLSILSLSTPHIHFGDDKAACTLARRINEESAALRDKYPERFGFAACLPTPCVEGSIEEACYSLDVLKADGVKLPSNSRGVYLGDDKFEPLFEELNKRGTVVIIHPSKPQEVPQNVFTAGPAPLYEYIGDTTRAVLNMITKGTIERYPNVKVLVPHCGSFIPFLAHRLIGISEVLIPQGMMAPVNVKSSIDKLYFDTAGNALPVAIASLLKITDPSHILFGGDFPYTPVQAIEHTKDALMTYEPFKGCTQDVFCDNALRLFGRM